MTYTSNTDDYIDLKLSRIIFDEKIADMVESLGDNFPKDLYNNLLDMNTFSLSDDRINRVLKGYKEGLQPVRVKKILGDKYMLIDGRHRMVAVIVLGGYSIPCKILLTPSFQSGSSSMNVFWKCCVSILEFLGRFAG